MLWPQVVEAVAPTPVLAAGGIGTGQQIAAALALGAQGVWTGLAVAHGRGGRPPAGAEAELLDAGVARHRALALVHRQAVPHAPQRLDRRVGAPGHPRPAPHAAAVHGVGQLRGARPPLRRTRPATCSSTRSARSSASSNSVEKTAAVIQRLVEEYLDAVEAVTVLQEV